MGVPDFTHEIEMSRMREAIEKKAEGFWSSFVKALAPTNLGKQMSEGLLAAGTAAAITGLGVAAGGGYRALREKIEKPKLFKGMMEAAPGLAKQDPKAVQMTFNTLYGMNRQMAQDPLVAGSFVSRNVGRADIGEGAGAYVDPQTAKMLMDAGSRQNSPVMDAWKGGASQPNLYKKMGSSEERGDKLKRFQSQLQQSSGSRGPRAQDPFAPKTADPYMQAVARGDLDEDIIRESRSVDLAGRIQDPPMKTLKPR